MRRPRVAPDGAKSAPSVLATLRRLRGHTRADRIADLRDTGRWRLWRIFASLLSPISWCCWLLMFLENSLIFLPFDTRQATGSPAGLDSRTPGSRRPTARGCTAGTCRSEKPGRRPLLPRQRRQRHASGRRPASCCTTRVGVSVLIFDYRGYGRSEGKPHERACWPTPALPGPGWPPA